MKTITARLLALTLATALIALLPGCGGSSSPDPEVCQPGVSTMRFPLGCATDSNGTVGIPTLKLVLFDTAGAAINQISPAQSGVLQALVKDKTGAVAPNVAVTFSTTDKTGTFVPTSGTALTDANGVAKVGLPAGTQIGAFTLTASAMVSGFPTAAKIDYAVAQPTLTLRVALFDATGAAITQVSPDQSGVLKALVKDKAGAVAPNVAVTFSTSDTTGAFVPKSGTALTDANGVAKVGLLAGTQAGAFTLSAGATFGDVAATAKADYAVAFPTLALSALGIAPATLSAGGNASVSVTVSSGGAAYAPPLPVSFTSPCIAADKATIGSPALTQSGMASASYSDKGCGVADVITASVTTGGTTVSRTGTINVLAAAAGSIKFVAADTTNIALKGTGGFGRQEFSTLKFQVYDTTGNPVSGKLVDFVFADSNTAQTVGGLALNPAVATSSADGSVTTLVAAGTIPTSVRVIASIHGSSPLITTLSNILVVSTGAPDQKHFSVSTETFNCEGRDFDQSCSIVTATLGDHFGNPVPDGTAVNFTTEGGIIGASCVTGSLPPPGATPIGQTTNSKVGPGSGTCSVMLLSGNPRPTDGRLTVFAYALGEEDFFDANGNNLFDPGDTFTDKSPDIFRDDNEDGIWNPGEPCVGPNSNGKCTTLGDGIYNGVLRIPQTPSAQTLYVSGQLAQIFSGSHALITPLNPVPVQLDHCVNGTPFVNSARTISFAVRDENPVTLPGNTLPGNILPAGTAIAFNVSNGKLLSEGSFTVPNTNDPSSAAWTYYVTLQSDATQTGPDSNPPYVCSNPVAGGLLTVKVTTPRGVITTQSFSVND